MSQPPRRVLLVDDDDAIIESVGCALVNHGYEVIIARDGAEALIRVERDAPDLVVLDVVMPKRSGLTVLDHIRRGQARVPHVIVVTANREQRHRDFAESRGIDAFISKPFPMEDLLAEVDAALKA